MPKHEIKHSFQLSKIEVEKILMDHLNARLADHQMVDPTFKFLSEIEYDADDEEAVFEGVEITWTKPGDPEIEEIEEIEGVIEEVPEVIGEVPDVEIAASDAQGRPTWVPLPPVEPTPEPTPGPLDTENEGDHDAEDYQPPESLPESLADGLHLGGMEVL